MNTAQFLKYLPRASRITLIICLTVGFNMDGNSETQPADLNSESATASKQNTRLDSVPFITLRNKTGSNKVSNYFGGERSSVRAGHCDVLSIPIKALKPIAEKIPFFIPEDREKLNTIRESTVEDLLLHMDAASNGLGPILHLHGFYVSFERACKRSSYFQEILGLTGRFLLFSWPSDGALLNYTRDESDLYWSVGPLEETLIDMVKHFGAGNINITAHSLGTRGVFLALVRMAQADHGTKPLVDQVILLAPDIDVGIFKQYVSEIQPLARRITVYVSSNDRPLALSRQVHGYPRLGESGTHLEGLTGIEIIDISDIPVRYPSGHVYHLYHDVVVNDLNQLLNEGKPASQRSNLKQTGENYWKLQLPAID